MLSGVLRPQIRSKPGKGSPLTFGRKALSASTKFSPDRTQSIIARKVEEGM